MSRPVSSDTSTHRISVPPSLHIDTHTDTSQNQAAATLTSNARLGRVKSGPQSTFKTMTLCLDAQRSSYLLYCTMQRQKFMVKSVQLDARAPWLATKFQCLHMSPSHIVHQPPTHLPPDSSFPPFTQIPLNYR